jgi:DNA polymerase-3 subunit beta
MKFSCNQQALAKALNTVSKAVSSKTTINILKGVLLKASADGKLKLSASDLDISIEKTIDANVEEEGLIVVSAKLFTEIIRKLPNDEVYIEVKENGNVNIKTLTSDFDIYGQSAEEFPNIGEVKDVKAQLSFDKKMFSDMVRKTFFCASIDESKGIIVGVLLELKDGSFSMAALDGFRMAVAREKMQYEKEEKIVISARNLNEINKILTDSESDEDIAVIISDKKAVILLEKTKIIVRLLEGDFIKYRDILPKEYKTDVIIDRKVLIDAIERASLMAKEGKNKLIRFNIKENLLNITSNSEEGRVKEDIIMEKTGDDLEIGFNSTYVMDALKAVEDEQIKMRFNTATTPCVVQPLGGEEYEYLILPVRIPSM